MTKSTLNNMYNKTISDVKAHPVSATLTGATLLLSAASCSKSLNLNKPKRYYDFDDNNSLSQFGSDVLNIFKVPSFNGHTLFNILSFYFVLRDIESLKGSVNTIKLITFDAFVGLFISYLVNNKLDFSKFSRSLLILSCFFKPEDQVLVYGLLVTKKLYLPLYQLALDFLLTFEPKNVFEGLLGTCFGVITGLTYQLLNSKNVIKF